MKRLGTMICAVVLLGWAGSAPAQGFDKAGTSGFQSLKLGIGARAAAMGETFVAMADDPSAAYWNPAGLARQGFGAQFSMLQWPADIHVNSAIVALPTPIGHFAFAATIMSTGYMIERTEFRPEGDGTVFNVGESVFAVSWATAFTDRFSFGITGKYLYQKLADVHDQTWAFDVGTLYMITPRLWMGMSAQNFGPGLGYQYGNDTNGKVPGASEPLPLMFQVGFAYTLVESGSNKLVTSVKGLHYNDNREEVSLGGEYSVMKMLFLRGGYRFNRDVGTWTAGAGVRIPFGVHAAMLDYAYSELGYLNQAHRASLTLTF